MPESPRPGRLVITLRFVGGVSTDTVERVRWVGAAAVGGAAREGSPSW